MLHTGRETCASPLAGRYHRGLSDALASRATIALNAEIVLGTNLEAQELRYRTTFCAVAVFARKATVTSSLAAG